MNPIMALLNSSNLQQPGQNTIFNIIDIIKNAKNPQTMFNSMIQTTPQLQQVMNYINSQGGNAQQAFYNLAQQRGIDPQSILDQLK